MEKKKIGNVIQKIMVVCIAVWGMLFLYGQEVYAANYIYTNDGTVNSFTNESGERVNNSIPFAGGDVITAKGGWGCIIFIEDENGHVIAEYQMNGEEDQFTFELGNYEYKMKDDGVLIFVRLHDDKSSQDSVQDDDISEEHPDTTAQGEAIPEGEDESHIHTYKTVKQRATETRDGRMEVVCEGCGYIKESAPINAMDVFCKNALEKIRSAAIGDTVVLESEIWYSLPAYAMEAIGARRDLTVVIKMTYEHQKYEIVISPEEHVEYTDAFYGVLYLSQLYEGVIVQ